jgi:hypothetical protein
VAHEPAEPPLHMTLLRQLAPESCEQLVVHVSLAGSHMQPVAAAHAPCVVYDAAHNPPHVLAAALYAQLGFAVQTDGLAMAEQIMEHREPSQLQLAEAVQSAREEIRAHVGWQKPADHMQRPSAPQLSASLY